MILGNQKRGYTIVGLALIFLFLLIKFLPASDPRINPFGILRGEQKPRPLDITLKVTIPAGTTISQLFNEIGLSTTTISAILESSKKTYDLAKIVSGRELFLTFANVGGIFQKLIYRIDTEKQLVIENLNGNFDVENNPDVNNNELKAKIVDIPYAVESAEIEGIIEESLYKTFLDRDFDVRMALALAEMFAWQIDFAADIRSGDSFKAVYEKRFLNGEYAMPGKILAAEFINDSQKFRGYYFESEKTKSGYYDEGGNSLQKEFLKSPLQYKYISSGFTYARLNPITKEVSPHRGIDYAANAGTAAVSVGDGTVIRAGWNGYYGIAVTIRHNETYKTVYGHFSRLAKGIVVGAKVKQGQVVGYVGSTGQSTGPHLHYEMHKFGNYVNPFTVEIPPGEPIYADDRPAFNALKQNLQF